MSEQSTGQKAITALAAAAGIAFALVNSANTLDTYAEQGAKLRDLQIKQQSLEPKKKE